MTSKRTSKRLTVVLLLIVLVPVSLLVAYSGYTAVRDQKLLNEYKDVAAHLPPHWQPTSTTARATVRSVCERSQCPQVEQVFELTNPSARNGRAELARSIAERSGWKVLETEPNGHLRAAKGDYHLDLDFSDNPSENGHPRARLAVGTTEHLLTWGG